MKRNEIIIKTSIKGIITNIVLVIFKMFVGLLAKSTAIILDALNNLSDVLSSVATIIGVKLSNKKPDKEHPYGHGRIEYFTTIIVSLIVFAAGAIALRESIDKIIHPNIPEYSIFTLIIIIVSIITKIVLGTYVKKKGKENDSDTLIASGNDAIFDSILSSSTLIAALIFMITKVNVDGYIGLIISSFIIKSSIEMIKNPINDIIGIRINTEMKEKLFKDIKEFKEVHGVYDLILHNYGPINVLGSVHIEVDDSMTAKEIHKLSKQIEAKIYEKYDIIMTVGIYAANTDSKLGKEIKKEIIRISKKYENIIQIHGFYISEKDKFVSFDIIYDFKEENVEKINNEIIDELKSKYKDYNFMIIVDKDIS